MAEPAPAPAPAPPPRVMVGASLLILLQFASRAVTFVANQVLLRYLTAQLLGISTHLEVYYLSVLFFARESLRVAIQRQGPTTTTTTTTTEQKQQIADADADASQAAVNLAHLAPLLGTLLAALLGATYIHNLTPATIAATPYLLPAVHLYALASLLELLSEPAFVLLQLRLQLTARARAEGLATIAKCIVTLGVAVWGGDKGVGVLPFALGQLAFGATLLGVYLLYARAQNLPLLPRPLLPSTTSAPSAAAAAAAASSYVLGWFYAPTLQLAGAMAAQNVVKYFLTQGDSLLMGVLASAQTQGVYALAANYGSLAARLVFQPVEEAARSYFSRLLAAAASSKSSDGKEKSSNGAAKAGNQQSDDAPNTLEHEKDATKAAESDTNTAASIAEASTALTRLLHIYTLTTLPLLTLGPPAAPLLLTLVAGAHWTAAGAGAALGAYVYYIPLLALNGLLEAFVASVATKRELAGQSAWMAGFFGVFAATAVVLVGEGTGWGWGLGATGVVVANGVNMALRIGWAGAFVRRWFGGAWSVMGCLPGPGAVAAVAVAGQVVRGVVVSEGVVGVKGVVWELGKVAGVGVVLLPVLAFTERRFLTECYRAVKAG